MQQPTTSTGTTPPARRRIVRVRLAAWSLILLVLGACSTGSSDGPATTTTAAPGTTTTTTTTPPAETAVLVAGFLFEPDTLAVPAETTVEFTNDDRILHTVTAGTPDDPAREAFDRMLDGRGATTTLTFEEPGTYDYFCTRHPHMRGSIEVTP